MRNFDITRTEREGIYLDPRQTALTVGVTSFTVPVIHSNIKNSRRNHKYVENKKLRSTPDYIKNLRERQKTLSKGIQKEINLYNKNVQEKGIDAAKKEIFGKQKEIFGKMNELQKVERSLRSRPTNLENLYKRISDKTLKVNKKAFTRGGILGLGTAGLAYFGAKEFNKQNNVMASMFNEQDNERVRQGVKKYIDRNYGIGTFDRIESEIKNSTINDNPVKAILTITKHTFKSFRSLVNKKEDGEVNPMQEAAKILLFVFIVNSTIITVFTYIVLGMIERKIPRAAIQNNPILKKDVPELSSMMALSFTSIISGPIIEELGKLIAKKRGVLQEFQLLFNTLEISLYVGKGGIRELPARLVLVLTHLLSTYNLYQKGDEKEYKALFQNISGHLIQNLVSSYLFLAPATYGLKSIARSVERKKNINYGLVKKGIKRLQKRPLYRVAENFRAKGGVLIGGALALGYVGRNKTMEKQNEIQSNQITAGLWTGASKEVEFTMKPLPGARITQYDIEDAIQKTPDVREVVNVTRDMTGNVHVQLIVAKDGDVMKIMKKVAAIVGGTLVTVGTGAVASMAFKFLTRR